MAPKIFITGITGYIGGDAFYAIHQAHPDYEYTALVRTKEKGKRVTDQYPDVKLVYGTNSDDATIAAAASAADIVIHTADASDDVPSARAIARGLAAGHSGHGSRPGYWLHICGTGMLTWYDEEHRRLGQPPLPDGSQTYRDVDDMARVTGLPDGAPHRDVDKIVLGANQPRRQPEDSEEAGGRPGGPAVRTAILSPPCIYGPGRGPGNTRSYQAYELARLALQNGWAPSVATGRTEWDSVHVHDLSALFLALVDAAVSGEHDSGPAGASGEEVFGAHGYYFLENGTPHAWGDLARWIAEEAAQQGYVAEAVVRSVSPEENLRIGGHSSFAANARSVAQRARKYFGWTPKGRSLREEVPDIVSSEAKRWGIAKKSA